MMNDDTVPTAGPPASDGPSQPGRPAAGSTDSTDTTRVIPTRVIPTSGNAAEASAPGATAADASSAGAPTPAAPAAPVATAVLDEPHEDVFPHTHTDAPVPGPGTPAAKTPSDKLYAPSGKAPGLLGAANTVVSGLLGVFWIWAPLSLFFIGIGGIFAIGMGVICLVLWLFLQRGINHVERVRAEAVYGDGIAVPVPRKSVREGFVGFLQDQWYVASSAGFWRSTVHHYVKAISGALVWGLALAGFFFGVGALTASINPNALPTDFPVDSGPTRLVAGALGVVAILVAAGIGWYASYLDRFYDRALLPPTRAHALRAEVTTLDAARAGAVDAATTERLRIERDLHDGVQPMLVALSMKLGMAKSKIDTDVPAAKVLVGEAHEDSKAAITELRRLARGIHPAVLTDRGLDPAISALAAQSVVPVQVTVDLPGHVDAEAESVAYFVVAEALTNVNKHSHATGALVRASVHDELLVVSVSDNGTGGARIDRTGRGTGLAGLADRVAAARGTLTLTSPVGGPTTIVVEVPCAS